MQVSIGSISGIDRKRTGSESGGWEVPGSDDGCEDAGNREGLSSVGADNERRRSDEKEGEIHRA